MMMVHLEPLLLPSYLSFFMGEALPNSLNDIPQFLYLQIHLG